MSEQMSGSSDSLQSAVFGDWLNANLTKGELEALRLVRGPWTMFRRGEPLALMPFTVLR